MTTISVKPTLDTLTQTLLEAHRVNATTPDKNCRIPDDTLFSTCMAGPVTMDGMRIGVRLCLDPSRLVKQLFNAIDLSKQRKQFYITFGHAAGITILTIGSTVKSLADPLLIEWKESLSKSSHTTESGIMCDTYRKYCERFKYLLEKKAYEIATLLGIKVVYNTCQVDGALVSHAKSEFVHYDGFVDRCVDCVTGEQKCLIPSCLDILPVRESVLNGKLCRDYQFFCDTNENGKLDLYFAVTKNQYNLFYLNYNLTPYLIGKISCACIKFTEVC